MDSSVASETSGDGYIYLNPKAPLSKKIFPCGFKQEVKEIMSIFFPILFTSFFRFSNPMISLIMCGHLNKTEFAAASLANSLINIFGVSIDLGFSTAFDTLFAQIYGSNQKKKMGGLLQRAVIVMTILYLILACFHLNIEPFLILLKQDPWITELTTYYITLYLPGLFFDFQFLAISRYLQNQNIVYPMMISAFLGNVFSGVSQYVAIHVYGHKLEASAVLQAGGCFVMFLVQLLYILISKVYKDTWSGFSLRDCLDNWKILFVIGIPGIFMIALEEWNFEVATLVSGTLGSIQLGAQSIAFQCSTISFMITMSLSIANGIRVGQFLGSRDINGIKTAYRTSFVIGFITSTSACILTLLLRNYIAAIFSNDAEIQYEGSMLLIFIAVMQFADVNGGLTGSILKACGKQTLGACVMFFCYYLIGVPMGLMLVFLAKTQIKGMWIGLITALVIETLIFGFFIYRIDWDIECDKAMSNVKGLDFDEASFQDLTESSPLMVKSDYEGDAHWVREKIKNPSLKIKNIRKYHASPVLSKNPTPLYRSRSSLVFRSQTFNIESDTSTHTLVLRRLILISCVMLLFTAALCFRIFFPKDYLPCIPVNNDSIIFYRGDPNRLCNSSLTMNSD